MQTRLRGRAFTRFVPFTVAASVLFLTRPDAARAQMILESALGSAALQRLSPSASADTDGTAEKDWTRDLAWFAAGLPLLSLLLGHGSAPGPDNMVTTPPLDTVPGGSGSSANGSWSSEGGPSTRDEGGAPGDTMGTQPAGGAASVPEPGLLALVAAPAAAFAISGRRRSRPRP
jgi:hypothetical protein